jgi:2'-5' RNA ligase
VAKMLRTFVAIRCGEEIAASLNRLAERLARKDERLKATATMDLHLTVQFLGDTREEDLMPISRALAAAAAKSQPVDARYVGLGAFPEPRRARVVWAGVQEEPAGVLKALARDVGERLEAVGFPPEARDWSAHVTLGRVKGPPSPVLVQAIEAAADVDLGEETLSDLKLILSRPEEGRYHYIDLTTVRLGSPLPR